MYKRILLKLSGEVLSGEGEKGFNHEQILYLIDELRVIKNIIE